MIDTRPRPNRWAHDRPVDPRPDLSYLNSDPFAIPKPKREYPLSFGVVRVRDHEMRKRQQQVLTALPQIVTRYFGYTLEPFHKEILRRLFRLSTQSTSERWGFEWSQHYPGGDESDPDLYQVIMVPTDHGKSVLATEVFPILSLMNDPNAAHIICCSNLEEARQLTDRVASHLDGSDPRFHELLHDYPWIGRPVSDRWAMANFNVAGREDRQNKNPSMHATGVGAKDIKGRRGKFVGDDLEGEDASALTAREKLYRWSTRAAVRCTEDPSTVFRPLHAYVGTPFDVDSFYFRLELEGFQVFRLPYRYPPLPQQKVGPLIWPQREEKIKALRKRLTRRDFNLQMWLDPSGGDESALSMDKLRELSEPGDPMTPESNPPREPDPVWHFVFCDPSSGSDRRDSDYAGIGICEVRWPVDDEMPYVTVRKPMAVRRGILEQCDLLAALHTETGHPVLIESNGYGFHTYKRLIAVHHPELVEHLVRFFTDDKRKWDDRMGLTVVRTLMMQKRLKVIGREIDPAEYEQDGEEWEAPESDPEVLRFLAEVRDLDDRNAHNHICAGVWFCIRWAYERRRTAQFKVVNRFQDRPVGRNYGRFGFGMTKTIDLSGMRG